MKRGFILFFCVVLVLSLCACQSSSLIEIGKKIQTDTLNIQLTDENNDREFYSSLEHLKEKQFQFDRTLVVRAKKDGLSTPCSEDCGEGFPPYTYFETPIEILEAFYGDVKAGEQLFLMEEYYQGTEALLCFSELMKEGEYLLILTRASGRTASNGTPLYSHGNTIYRIDQYEELKAKAAQGDSDAKIGVEAIDYYLRCPDTRMDVQAESAP
ncbi:MAG: hypothetical protein IJ333_10400 [Clostridia bacterium]|nr:hypothetical protein [Clostridia bacterium]